MESFNNNNNNNNQVGNTSRIKHTIYQTKISSEHIILGYYKQRAKIYTWIQIEMIISSLFYISFCSLRIIYDWLILTRFPFQLFIFSCYLTLTIFDVYIARAISINNTTQGFLEMVVKEDSAARFAAQFSCPHWTKSFYLITVTWEQRIYDLIQILQNLQ